jgi:hypothetical protein
MTRSDSHFYVGWLADMTAFLKPGETQEGEQAQGHALPRSRPADLFVNLLALGALWFAYSAARGITADDFSVAMSNASGLLDLQAVMRLPSELSLQKSFLGRTSLLKAANIHYISVHFPVTVLFLAWAWIAHRDRFNRIRNSLIGVTGMGLVLHITYPLAPPRMLPEFVDTGVLFGPNPYDLKISEAANQIAAMPSLHVAWALLVALGLILLFESKWRFLALLHPTLTVCVVVITANHYWSDAIVAAALAAVAWFGFGGPWRSVRLGDT